MPALKIGEERRRNRSANGEKYGKTKPEVKQGRAIWRYPPRSKNEAPLSLVGKNGPRPTWEKKDRGLGGVEEWI